MGAIIKVMGAVGVADAVWMAVDRERWAGFWRGFIERVGKEARLARTLAALELAAGLYMLARPRRR